MKECPTCRQVYDATLRFCRFDGAPLRSKGVRSDEAVTITFPTGKLSNRLAKSRAPARRKGETQE